MRWSFWIWLFGLVAGVAYALIPGQAVEPYYVAGFGGHAAGFAALTAAGVAAAGWKRGWLVALGTFALGVALEFVQNLVPGRGYELPDVEANLLGVVVGWLCAEGWGWWARRRGAAADVSPE
ncbi:MAG: hypothetical protein HY821_06340 [Acidobacteria bacterium]|nr:hypothetical protein [Acidobacteriota bacterium]